MTVVCCNKKLVIQTRASNRHLNLQPGCQPRGFTYHMSTGDSFIRLMKDDPSTVKGAETLILGEMLTLPQNFG